MKVDIENEFLNPVTRDDNAAPKRALVINDEPAMSVLIQDVLAAASMESLILDGEGEVETYFQEEKFEVILIGLGGTSENGIEMVGKIRRSGINQKTPIIVISEDQDPRALARGFKAGASFFVYKPMDKAHLMNLIRVTRGSIEYEKRRFRRVPVKAKIRLKSDEEEIVGETIDLSLNGSLVRASRALPLGSAAEVSLYLFDGMNPVIGRGSVVRILSHNRMGIMIDDLSIEECGRLQEYLLPRITEKV